MKRSLSFRLSMVLIMYTGAILVIASIVIILITHYHFQLYNNEMAASEQHTASLNTHLEQAIIQSIGLSIGGGFIIAIILSIYIARRISFPLISMRNLTLIMARGKHDVRLPLKKVNKDELDELAASINHLAEQLQQQEQLRVAMTENIAHELRTPLTTLNSYLAAIQDGVWEPTPERIQSSREEIYRLIQLVQNLEELQTLNSSHFSLVRKETALQKSIQQVVNLMRPSFEAKAIRLTEANLPDVCLMADESRLVQIWTNLLSNALKFTPRGGMVQLSGIRTAHAVVITITDSGIGIPAEQLTAIFERFYRVDKSRNRDRGGEGLGLAITKMLVEHHGGQIWAESTPGKGTSMHVKLPRLTSEIGDCNTS